MPDLPQNFSGSSLNSILTDSLMKCYKIRAKHYKNWQQTNTSGILLRNAIF